MSSVDHSTSCHSTGKAVKKMNWKGRVRVEAKKGGGEVEKKTNEQSKTSFFTSITDALDFAQTRSEKDAEHLEGARIAAKMLKKRAMSRVSFPALGVPLVLNKVAVQEHELYTYDAVVQIVPPQAVALQPLIILGMHTAENFLECNKELDVRVSNSPLQGIKQGQLSSSFLGKLPMPSRHCCRQGALSTRRLHLRVPISVQSMVSDLSGEDSASDDQRWRAVKQKLGVLLSNAQKRSKQIKQARHSLGIDFGDARTGVSISLSGYAPRPLTVLSMRGDKLIDHLLKIAAEENADELIVGLPRSFDGKETAQSSKTRSFAGRLAGQAALRGWRVYLQDEYGSTQDGLGYMLEIGVKKRSRKEMIDAYAAVVLLATYFNNDGARTQLVVPKGLFAQEQLCLGSNLVAVDRWSTSDFDEDDNYEYED
ncbi:hypothetical protein R1flu_000874 [Riccia fluitans]|uniref:YqgF/RNase H-like domain-containing protein n=1 Tax=Riccia fluitans TaxID=41844 RepID=A0ABD1Y1N0_9MARC